MKLNRESKSLQASASQHGRRQRQADQNLFVRWLLLVKLDFLAEGWKKRKKGKTRKKRYLLYVSYRSHQLCSIIVNLTLKRCVTVFTGGEGYSIILSRCWNHLMVVLQGTWKRAITGLEPTFLSFCLVIKLKRQLVIAVGHGIGLHFWGEERNKNFDRFDEASLIESFAISRQRWLLVSKILEELISK